MKSSIVLVGIVLGVLGVGALFVGGSMIQESVATYEGWFVTYDFIVDEELYTAGVACVYGGIVLAVVGFILFIIGLVVDDAPRAPAPAVQYHYYQQQPYYPPQASPQPPQPPQPQPQPPPQPSGFTTEEVQLILEARDRQRAAVTEVEVLKKKIAELEATKNTPSGEPRREQ